MNMRMSLILGVLLAASAVAQAQTVGIDAAGNVDVDAGDGNRVQYSADGGVRAGATATSTRSSQNMASNSGTRTVPGDSTQREIVRGSRVNVATPGGVSVTGAEGGTATTTINGRTVTSGGGAANGVVTYINGELDGHDFTRRNLTGAAFTNASLRRASFAHSILIGADFANADLTSADLRGANLHNADITNADLDNARLDGAVWIDGRKCGAGSTGRCR
jgi:uncharacterized protein YjbI with pentapeptide repeats